MLKHKASVGIYEVFLEMIIVLHFIRKIRIHPMKEENKFLHTGNNIHIVMKWGFPLQTQETKIIGWNKICDSL